MNKSPKLSVAAAVFCVLGAAGALSISSCDTINQILSDGGAVEDAGGTVFDAGSGPCGTCINDKCAAPSAACGADSDCSRLWNCIGACGGDYYCQQLCEKQHPGGFGTYFSFITCLHNSCPTTCFSGTAIPDSGTVVDTGLPFDAGIPFDAGVDAGTPGDAGVDGGTCAPDCAGKVCGYLDGCGGRCTNCEDPRLVCNTGTWFCETITWPSCDECTNYHCHDEFDTCSKNSDCTLIYNCNLKDGCYRDSCFETCIAGNPGGASAFEAFEACVSGRCGEVCYRNCTPDCTGKYCGGWDGCGGRCNDCANAGETCKLTTWTCEACTPDCTGKVCGEDNGCGGKCTDCDNYQACSKVSWTCEPCDPDCDGKECGDNGCGRLCPDRCVAPDQCGGGGAPFKCGCTPVCAGKVCGDDDSCGNRCFDCPTYGDICGGGGTYTCGPGGPCLQCWNFRCQQEIMSCFANSECEVLSKCALACGSDCGQQCYDDHPDGIDSWMDLVNCTQDQCELECVF